MKVSIIGAGYVGLVTGSCLARLGHSVTCIDIDIKKIELLNNGLCPIYEPNLEKLIQEMKSEKRLFFSTEWANAIQESKVIFLAVGTPSASDGSLDLSYIYQACKSITPYLTSEKVIITRSTVPVGTSKKLQAFILEQNPSLKMNIVSNPEFLREGSAIHEFMNPDRIIIGSNSEKANDILKELYQEFFNKNIPILFTNPETSELVKQAANSFLAIKISFINEMANLCELAGANIKDLSYGLGLDKRIGKNFLQPGPGYGGSCLPKDTLGLCNVASALGIESKITAAAIEVNEKQKIKMVEKIINALDGNLNNKTLCILGLSFKPDTGDLREAPSLGIMRELIKRGLKIKAHDPVAMPEAQKILPEVIYCKDPYSATESCDGICLITEWELYKSLDLNLLLKNLNTPIFIDLRNVYESSAIKKFGFTYHGIGL